jgi:hypothetical protein
MSLWDQGNGLICDENGHLVDCDSCPCGPPSYEVTSWYYKQTASVHWRFKSAIPVGPHEVIEGRWFATISGSENVGQYLEVSTDAGGNWIDSTTSYMFVRLTEGFGQGHEVAVTLGSGGAVLSVYKITEGLVGDYVEDPSNSVLGDLNPGDIEAAVGSQ